MLRTVTILVLWVFILIGISVVGIYVYYDIAANNAQSSLGTEAPVLEVNGIQFRDLNKNGLMDPYENPELPWLIEFKMCYRK